MNGRHPKGFGAQGRKFIKYLDSDDDHKWMRRSLPHEKFPDMYFDTVFPEFYKQNVKTKEAEAELIRSIIDFGFFMDFMLLTRRQLNTGGGAGSQSNEYELYSAFADVVKQKAEDALEEAHKESEAFNKECEE